MLPTKLSLARLTAAVAANSSRRSLHLTAIASGGHHHEMQNDGLAIANGREYVAYFSNGEPAYDDRTDLPFPSIRFRKPDAEYMALREKEKGDWKSLTMEEKKKLYRYTFRATFAEFDHPTGYWKPVLALTLAMTTLSMAIIVLVRRWIMRKNLWHFSDEAKNKNLEFMIQVYSDPITGVASKWDYEKNVWKA